MLDLVDQELKEEFFEEFKELTHSIEEFLLKLEKEPDNLFYIRELFRPFHTIKGNAGLIGEKDIQSISQLSESVLDEVRQGRQKITQQILDTCLKSVDIIKEISIKRESETLSSSIVEVKNELSKILVSFSEEKTQEIQEKSVSFRHPVSRLVLPKEKIFKILMSLSDFESSLDQMKYRKDFTMFLSDAFDKVLDLSYDIPRNRHFSAINSIISYLEIYLTVINMEDRLVYSQEKWDLLNLFKEDLLYQLFPIILESLNIKILYYNEDDSQEDLEKAIQDAIRNDVPYILINLNLHHSPKRNEVEMIYHLIQGFPDRIYLVQRYIGQQIFWHSLNMLTDKIPNLYKSFWQVLYTIASNKSKSLRSFL